MGYPEGMTALIDLFSRARTVVVAGPRPVSERKAAPALRQAMRLGLLAVVLSGTSAMAQASEASATETTLLASGQPVWVASELDRRAPALDWVLPTGQVDGATLLSRWEAHGVSPQQATELLNVLVLTQSPVIANDPLVLARAQAQTQATAGIFDVTTPEDAEAFLKDQGLEALVLRGVLHSGEAFSNAEGASFTWEDVFQYWQQLSPDRLDERNSEARVTGWGIDPNHQDMAGARDALIEAVRDTGLSGLRVPLPVWNDSANVRVVAERLIESNRLLQSVTGWEGPVLGLRGRVELTPYNPIAAGSTVYRSKNETIVLSGWEDLPHEWFHAVDFALRSAKVDLDADGGTTLTQQWAARPGGSPLEQAWGTLTQRLQDHAQAAGHTWHADRHARAEALSESHKHHDQWMARYLQQPHETAAAAWMAYVQTHLNPQSASWIPRANDGEMGPKEAEAQAAGPLWKGLMAQTRQEWWNPAGSTTQQWRDQRRETPRPHKETAFRKPGR